MNLVPPDTVIVMFGGNGDLARRKLIPALWRLHQEGLLPDNWRIIGNSRNEFSDEEFDTFAKEAITEFCGDTPSGQAWDVFADRLTYVSGEFTPDATELLRDEILAAEHDLGGEPRRLFYLAVPPPAFPLITEALHEAKLTERARVVYEKPFGLDEQSFRELNELAHQVLADEQIYTIDHFLGKETLQNVLALRFANGMFEPVWNRQHIDHVQIDVPEELGIGTRGAFYEKTGALRDMIVTHLFQVLGVIAMEPPYAFGAKPLLDEKLKVFESMLPLRRENTVRGQFDGYRQVNGVAADSEAETFVAARAYVDNWRWAGVPFYLRTGKRMADSRQSVTLAFREPPSRLFPELPRDSQPNDHLTLELGAQEQMRISFLAKKPGPALELAPATMTFTYERSFGSEAIGPYERLIHDALMGDRTLFTRADGIERTWELVADVLAAPPALHPYPQGSWGPTAADELIAPRRWHLPA
ncbi:MAG: glucose-6-phosphate dehydrogenase [Actinomycetota bacterium]|jgi:glucose-6-phosphate 1-dehydrogenase|nr:glucose-6-phosphate dehydrogenase [Actinomycetota bacterium]